MQGTFGRIVAALAGLLVIVAALAAQGPPAGVSQDQAGAPAGSGGAGGDGGRGGGAGGRGLTSFPAQQRPLADPVVVDRGKQIYGIHCRACHGVDLRGGDMGGPNLLRSDVMLNDQTGELLLPVLKGSRASAGMNAIDLPPDDVAAVAAYIHSVLATSRPQGAPPTGPVPTLDILVGNAAEGEAFFGAKCSGCHSVAGDLQGIGAKYASATELQNLWVAGGRRGRGAGPGTDLVDLPPPGPGDVSVVVTPQAGPKVEGWLEHIDDFTVSVLLADGTRRSFRRNGDTPGIEMTDPLATHKALLLTYTDRDIHNVTAYLATLK